MRRIRVLLLVVASSSACRSDTPNESSSSHERGPAEPSTTRASVPIPELAACRSLLEADEPTTRDEVRRCDVAVFARCGDPSSSDGIVRITTAMEACRNKYCPRFETQQPDLCQGYDPVYATAGGAPRAAEDATEFLAAMLALVHDRDRKDDSVQEVAALQAGRFAHVYQVVNTPLPSLLPQDDAKAAALGLTVSITPEGFTITGKDLEPKRIAAAGPGDTEARWDWAGLEAEARRLKSLHPEVGTVTLRPDASIPLAVLTRVMDAMRGSDCDPLDDASKCLFFDVIVDRSG